MSSNSKKWGIRAGKTVYDNPWICVREYDSIAPTGAPAQYGLVHMKNFALGVVPIDDEGRTFLIGQERFVFGRYSWELPEGGGDIERPPIEGAKRELSEEAGVSAAHWYPLLEDVHLSNSVTDERAYAFVAWGLSADDSHQMDESEDLSVRRVPFKKALDMAIHGEITDVFSLVMLLKTHHLAQMGMLPKDVCDLILA